MTRVTNNSQVSQASSNTNHAGALKQHHRLAYGSSGEEVKQLQRLLQARGLYDGPIDGQFGPKTKAGVTAYQKKNGLEVDGVVGQQTWGSMLFGASYPPGSSMLAPSPRHNSSDGFERSGGSNKYTGSTSRGSSRGAPAELAKYGNGHIPASALESIGIGGHRMYGPAAEAFKRMRADAAAAGVNIGVTDSYRSYEAQVDCARRKGLYSQGGLAAKPGTSKHGWGLALDLDIGSKATAWLKANASKYGFYGDTPREPWHWEYRR